MLKSDIAIIINSFNRLGLLKECLRALAAWIPSTQFKMRCVAVVYDAGSTDGSLKWLTEEAPKLGIVLKVITPEPGEDTSFAAGLNAGVAYAHAHYPSLKYLLFYETDNQILSSYPLLQAIEQIENRSRIAACGFTVRLHNGKPAGVGQSFPSLLNFILGNKIVDRFQLERIPYVWQENTEGTAFSLVDVVYTSPLLVRVDAWLESGGLDATMFPFSDCDVDWARRLWQLSWRMGVIRTNDVVHDNQATLSNWSNTRIIQSHRGRLRYFKRHHPVSVLLAWPILLTVRHLLELLSVQILIRNPIRRFRLTKQVFNLLRTSIRNYE